MRLAAEDPFKDSAIKISPLLCFYADDFTGATDALDALHVAGVDATLILDTSEETVREFAGGDAIGLAGTSRTMSPEEMDVVLPEVYRWMRRTGARICHYKVCSTFDSSPNIGNIGHAIRIAEHYFDPGPMPVVVGTPRLGRYVAFGSLFARGGGAAHVHRLDRHPVMSQHPITPMHESDLAEVLGMQAKVDVTLTSIADMGAGRWPKHGSTLRSAHVFDTIDNDELKSVGSWINNEADKRTVFCVGSSRVETALVECGALVSTSAHHSERHLLKHNRMVVVSGSCSKTTSSQIDVAVAAGFVPVLLDVDRLMLDPEIKNAIATTVRAASEAIALGNDPIIYSAKGARTDTRIGGPTDLESRIGECLGEKLSELLTIHPIDRLPLQAGTPQAALRGRTARSQSKSPCI